MKTKNYNIIHISALLCWCLVMALFLSKYFSVQALCIFLISAVYLFYVDIMKAEEFRSLRRKRDGAICMSLTNSFRQLLGVSSLTLLGFYIVSFWPFAVMEWKPSEWTGFFTLFFTRYVEIFRDGNYILIAVLVVLFSISLFKPNPGKSKVLDLIYRYLLTGVFYFFLFYAYRNDIRTGIFYIGVSIVFFGGDLLHWKNILSEKIEKNKWHKWFSFLLLFFFVMEDRIGAYLSQNGYLEYYIFVEGLNLKNFILISLSLIILGIVCWIFEDKEKIVKDSFLCLYNLSTIAIIFFTYRFYAAYWWIILAAYIIGSFVWILLLKENMDEEQPGKQYIQFLTFPATAIFLLFEAHTGRIVSSLLFVISIAIICLSWIKLMKAEKEWNSIALFSTIVLVCIGITAAGRVYEVRNLSGNYITLFILGVFFTLCIWVCCYNPDVFRVKSETLRCGGILCMFAILSLCICFRSGSKIKIERLDNNQVKISASANGKKNSVVSNEEYWTSDYTQAFLMQGNDTLPEEQKISEEIQENTFTVPGSGKIRVVVTDEHGMKTTAVRWFRMCAYSPKAALQGEDETGETAAEEVQENVENP